MTPPRAPLRVLAKLAGRSLDETYRLFRLPTAPPPAEHVACVPAYDLGPALEHLGVPSAKIQAKIAAFVAKQAANGTAIASRTSESADSAAV